MDADKRLLEREALRNMIQQWNANRLDLFELSEPNENLEFHGVMRFYFQDSGQKIATKCIRVASDATVSDVIETLIEKFRPDMRMLSLGSYTLWETHGPDDERQLAPHEKPLLVQLNWHSDDREGRFLLKCREGESLPAPEKGDQNFKRKLSKREKKELKRSEKLAARPERDAAEPPVAEKLYKELPETSFTRSISNPEAVMRRRRHLKLERKLQQFRSKDGGPDTGGTLKIYGASLCPDVPYKTLLLSVGDTAAAVLRETLDKYGLARQHPAHYCIVQTDSSDNSEYILEDDECPLAIVMTHPHHGSIMFHVRRRPADSAPRRRKKKTSGAGGGRPGLEPLLLEVAPDGSALENPRRLRVNDLVEIGSANGAALQLYGPSIQPRHCALAPADGGGHTVTPLHPDAAVCVNGQRVAHAHRLQHGNILKIGRVSTFRFVDPAQENMLSHDRAPPHYGSGSIYDRSSREAGAVSPASHPGEDEYPRAASPASHQDSCSYSESVPFNNNNNSIKEEPKEGYQDAYEQEAKSNSYKDNYETTFDLEGNVETKSICSAKSGGSGHDARMNASLPPSARASQEAILPAVLEFPEAGQEQLLAAVISRLDPHAPAFKLAPVYTLYLCARYRASTHYRPELSPTERAHKLTAFLHHVAALIHATVQERCGDSAAQAFWMANASELLHFLKCDRHICSFSTQAQELLPSTVQNAFSNLVSCFQEELSPALAALNSGLGADATDATAPTLQALAAAMVLLRRCRVNAALTIQLFSHLFHYVNAVCFNKLVTDPSLLEPRWGAALAARLALLAAWAERQGLELAADCHLAKSHQAARLIQGEDVADSRLNSAQVWALLARRPAAARAAAAARARARADELARADGREITLEESEWLGAGLLLPGDGFSAEVVRGVPPGLAEFIAPLQRGALCRLVAQGAAQGAWSVYLTGYGAPPRAAAPRVHIIQLNKNANGMGLSIVAAKGAGQSKLGIYIKSVVPGGAAAADARLAAGDQLLSVDGHSLVGISQEKAAEYLVRTGPAVTLEVAKQGAVLHGLATLLHQPAYNQKQDSRACNGRCHLRDESSESSSSGSSPPRAPPRPLAPRPLAPRPAPRAIPRLVITLDDENNEYIDEQSPATPGCPLELQSRPIPVFTYTCVDYDDLKASEPPEVPEPPVGYAEEVRLPPVMRPIDTQLTLDLFNMRDTEAFRRSTRGDECASACECCRSRRPDDPLIPYIDAPNSDPYMYESDIGDTAAAAPKTRRILPALSLEERPDTADAVCQTPGTPEESAAPADLQDPGDSRRVEEIHSRLRRALFDVSKSLSRSEDTEPLTTSTGSLDDNCNEPRPPLNAEAKSWKSPDEYRPAFGRVRQLARHFNGIHLKYCAASYRRNCRSSPNLSARSERPEPRAGLPTSASLADVRFDSKTNSDTKGQKLSDAEVKSILIQLEDWSKFGSRGSEDTLAQGNEFEVPNLPAEDHADYVFTEIVDKKPRTITLDNIRLKGADSRRPRVVAARRKAASLADVSGDVTRGTRRPDMPRVAPSRSTPALHRPDPPLVGQSAGAAEWAGKSRSSHSLTHNLSPPLGPGLAPGLAPGLGPGLGHGLHSHSLADVYQNLPAHAPPPAVDRTDKWAPARPQSAHFMTGDPASPDMQHKGSTLSVRAAKLAEMSEEVTRRQHQQHRPPQTLLHSPPPPLAMQQMMPQSPPMMTHQHMMAQMQSPQQIVQNHQQMLQSHQQMMQGQQQQQGQALQQMAQNHQQMAQSHQQMMHNQQQIGQNHQQLGQNHQQMGQNVQQMGPNHQQMVHNHQQMGQNHQQIGQNHQQMGQNHQQIGQNHQQMGQNHQQMGQNHQQMVQNHQQMGQNHQHYPQVASPTPPQYANQLQQQQRYDWPHAGPPSPQRAQPPVAPKPQSMRRSELDLRAPDGPGPADDEGRGEPLTAWQREARERDAEARRQVARARRDATIAALSALGAARSPAQGQQLRALQLERNFDRRALHEQEEGGDAPPAAPAAPATPGGDERPQPKSILKSRGELSNGFAQEPPPERASPPPPPERGSSFAVMAARALSPPLSPAAPAPAPTAPAPAVAAPAPNQATTPNNAPRDKRVSFHASGEPAPAPAAPAAESPPPGAAPPPPDTAPPREDPDRFIDEAESMLWGAGPPSPPGAAPAPHTPGVIGAQEVYRDPRARRLAQLSARAPAPVPEQLSFKDKMKMFALESGEPNTPKDKVKISRAQRDIDAVH